MADANAARRDEVLVAFHAACPRPTAEDLATWIDRHPDLADDLRTHAEALLAGIQDRHLRPEVSDALLARTRSAALDALETARARSQANATVPAGLEELMTAAETDIPSLARLLGLGRAPLVDLVQARVVVPAPVALLAALADALRTTVGTVDAAIRTATPRIGIAKADVVPFAPRRPFIDIVRTDPTMTEANKTRWLALLQAD